MKFLNYLTRNQKLGTLKGTFIAEEHSPRKVSHRNIFRASAKEEFLFRNSYEGCEIRRLLPRWIPTEKGTMVSRVADEWDEEEESRGKGKKEGRVGKKWKRAGWRKKGRKSERKKKRKKEEGEEGKTIVGCGGGRFALKFKYHSRGRALTLRSVEHSGPIWIHYNVFASSPGPVMPSIRIMPPHFNTTGEGQRKNDASKLFGNEDIRITNNRLVPSTILNNPKDKGNNPHQWLTTAVT